MSQLDLEQFLSFFEDSISPHGFTLDEPKNVDIEKVFGEALNDFFSEGFCQMFHVPRSIILSSVFVV